MAFKITNSMVDTINKTVNAVFQDQPQQGPGRMVQLSFPFSPPPAEAAETAHVIAAAKQVLQQLLNDWPAAGSVDTRLS